MSNAPQYNLGPQDIAPTAEGGGLNYLLANSEWNTLQWHVDNLMTKDIMPTTGADLSALLGSGAPADLKDFEPLLNAYGDIYTHVAEWHFTTFQKMVSLGLDVENYASNSDLLYGHLEDNASKLASDPENAAVKRDLKALLEEMISHLNGHATHAGTLLGQGQAFAKQITQGKTTLGGADGTGALYKNYHDTYGTSEEVLSLKEQLQGQRAITNQANAQYDEGAMRAVQACVYLYVPPLGAIGEFIAEGGGGSSFGTKGYAAMNKAKAVQQQIGKLPADQQVSANLLKSLNLTLDDLTQILASTTKTNALVEIMQTTWESIANSLGNLKGLISTDPSKAATILQGLDIKKAIQDWKSVSKAAKDYQSIAYVSIG